ncbi:hypothetical protein GOBAR_DD06628 [Gossypium barbadense]|nr:hypothetical protein GOBAR_DD06628 [Gossypium barbadense]
MTSHEDDLDLLLSLQERVLETPPASPSSPHSQSPGYLSDDGSPRRRGKADLSVFKDFVEDCLDYEPKSVERHAKPKPQSSNDIQVEKFSGLRIRKQLVSPAKLSEHLSDIRFVRLPTLKYAILPLLVVTNLLVGDTLYGCWATIGVLIEKGIPKTSSIGKSYSIWKIGCLDKNTVSLFLFGDAYEQNSKEQVGTVFALFSCTVRKDTKGSGFSLSVAAPNQILKIGTSADYGVCKGRRKDGMACTIILNKYATTFTTGKKKLKWKSDLNDASELPNEWLWPVLLVLASSTIHDYKLPAVITLLAFTTGKKKLKWKSDLDDASELPNEWLWPVLLVLASSTIHDYKLPAVITLLAKASERYSTKRTELMGGNLRRAFRNPPRSEGIYMVDPLSDRTNMEKASKPVKLLSVDALKQALRNGDKVTTNRHSQGIRFLNAVTGEMSTKLVNGASKKPDQQTVGSEKRIHPSLLRKESSVKQDTSLKRNNHLDSKRRKLEQEQTLEDHWNQRWKLD